MLIAFLIFLSGNFFERRIFSDLCAENLISPTKKKLFQWFFVIFKILLAFFLKKSLLLAWIMLLLPALSLKSVSFQIKFSREKAFEDQFIEFLNLFLLFLKSGRSFSVSFQLSVESSPEKYRQKFNDLYNFVFFNSRNTREPRTLFLKSVISDLSRAAKAPQNASKLVVSLRDRLKSQREIQERASVMTQTARTQAYFLLPLYLGLCGFSAANFGFYENISLYLLSGCLFSAGLLWLTQIGKDLSWRT